MPDEDCFTTGKAADTGSLQAVKAKKDKL